MDFVNQALITLAKDLNEFNYQTEVLYRKLLQKKMNNSSALKRNETHDSYTKIIK